MKALKIIGGAFLLIGVLLLLITNGVVLHTRSFLSSSTTVEGEVIDLVLDRSHSGSTHGVYHPVVQFIDSNGTEIEFRGSIGSRPPKHEVGESVRVRYDTENPHRAKIDTYFSIWLASIILGCLGCVFSAVGGGMTVYFFKVKNRQKTLRERGVNLRTELVSVDQDLNTTINGFHPWRIHSQYFDRSTHQHFSFRSDCIRFDPTPFLKSTWIEVKVNPADYHHYEIDLSFLPKSGDEIVN